MYLFIYLNLEIAWFFSKRKVLGMYSGSETCFCNHRTSISLPTEFFFPHWDFPFPYYFTSLCILNGIFWGSEQQTPLAEWLIELWGAQWTYWMRFPKISLNSYPFSAMKVSWIFIRSHRSNFETDYCVSWMALTHTCKRVAIAIHS